MSCSATSARPLPGLSATARWRDHSVSLPALPHALKFKFGRYARSWPPAPGGPMQLLAKTGQQGLLCQVAMLLMSQ